MINNVVLLHGWGLNKAVWGQYLEALEGRFPQINFYLLDIPGYGGLSTQDSSSDIKKLALACLDQAPEQALWVGWSLGGMIAMQAALLDVEQNQQRVQGLQIINAAPKFVASDDWPSGVDITMFEKFSNALANDYERSLTSFLLLQAGASDGARQLARDTQKTIAEYPNPTALTLSQGIECLASVDLRNELSKLTLPVQVVSGALDRVTMPASSRALADMLSASLFEIHSGHAPFLTHVTEMLDQFELFLSSISENDE